jgi:hypothetical protein
MLTVIASAAAIVAPFAAAALAWWLQRRENRRQAARSWWNQWSVDMGDSCRRGARRILAGPLDRFSASPDLMAVCIFLERLATFVQERDVDAKALHALMGDDIVAWSDFFEYSASPMARSPSNDLKRLCRRMKEFGAGDSFDRLEYMRSLASEAA